MRKKIVKMDFKAVAIGALVLSMMLVFAIKDHNKRIYIVEEKIETLINQLCNDND